MLDIIIQIILCAIILYLNGRLVKMEKSLSHHADYSHKLRDATVGEFVKVSESLNGVINNQNEIMRILKDDNETIH